MPGLFRSFLKDVRGVSALMFGLAAPALALAVGGGIDLSQAAARRQRIASAVELGCQQAAKDIAKLAESNPNQNFTSTANQVISSWVSGLTQNGVSGVTASTSISNNVITVNATAASANAFGGILGFDTINLAVQRTCNITLASAQNGQLIFSESFENNHNVASNSWTVLNNWNGWTTLSGKGGIEINGIPELAANDMRFGNFFAELDSHCYTSNCRTNSAMYRDFKAPVSGAYELRYWYISRVRNPAYGNQVICATKTAASNWATAVDWATWEQQTNRIEVFFDKNTATIPASNLSNMVDVCVHSSQWTERVVKFTNLVKGTTYRIYFRAAGREDTYGGLIDYIRFCSGACP